MSIKWTKPYPPFPSRRPSEESTPKDKHEDGCSAEPDDLLWPREWMARWLSRWGADLLLTAGAALVSVGVGWIYPPAGLIAAGALLIAGGVLWAKGGGDP